MTDGTGSTPTSGSKSFRDEPLTETVSLPLDNGAIMRFCGRQFAGGSWYDEETGTLTNQTLYVTSSNEHVYAVSERRGAKRSRRAYRVSMDGDLCTIIDGSQEITISLDMLMTAVKALAGLDHMSAEALAAVEDTLRAANA